MGSLNHLCIFGYILKIVFLDFLLFPLGNLKFLSAEQHKPFFILMVLVFPSCKSVTVLKIFSL